MSSCLDRGVSDGVGGVPLLAGQAAIDYTVLALMVLGNSFIVASVCRYRRHYPVHGTAASARFAANLALADTYVGVATGYFLVFRYFCWAQDVLGSRRFSCVLRFFLVSSAHMTSAYSLGAIALDRYVAVMHALQYRKIMNLRRSATLLITVWVCPLATCSPLLYWNNWTDGIICEVEAVVPVEFVTVIGMLTHASIIITVTVIHYRVHREAVAVKKRRRCDESQQVIFTFRCPDGNHLSAPRAINTKSARIVLYVTGVYFFSWAPYTVLYIIKSCGYSSPEINVIYRLCFSFANINYLINPFLYSWNNSAVRKSIISSLKCLGVLNKQKHGVGSRSSSSRISSAVPSGPSVHGIR
ncbi:melanocyte-stimulating hormone receptor-like [Schistocerca americana]|uniref:melanocyte-stimulating hormone receptor-like n=1 Tax=Schistocerca americana TaxID=7009 RepID=UPI001F4F1F75|nr:melanocyte-stimulating hormone receptor-like [Schistocerca americana]